MLTQLEKSIIRELQAGLPLVSRPFAQLGKKFNLSEDEILAMVQNMVQKGYLRRIGAALRHQKVGYAANAMVVWKVPLDQIEKAGKTLVTHSDISHCYQRASREGWPYNFYTMIHKQTKEECYELAKELATEIGIWDYRLVFSTKELKKSSMKYFSDDLVEE